MAKAHTSRAPATTHTSVPGKAHTSKINNQKLSNVKSRTLTEFVLHENSRTEIRTIRDVIALEVLGDRWDLPTVPAHTLRRRLRRRLRASVGPSEVAGVDLETSFRRADAVPNPRTLQCGILAVECDPRVFLRGGEHVVRDVQLVFLFLVFGDFKKQKRQKTQSAVVTG